MKLCRSRPAFYLAAMLFSEIVEIIDPDPHHGALNMAIDEILLRGAERPAIRLYRWSEPTVSFGYFGTLAAAEELAAGRALVRRWTGGGIVEHGTDLTYTLVVPRTHPFCRYGAAESYHLIHVAIARWLVGQGTAAQVVPAGRAPISSTCFANPVQHDLMADGTKIAGAAQRRTRWGLLHQGSIQAKDLPESSREKIPGVFASKASRCALAPEWQEAASVLAAAKYGTADWLRKF